MSLGEAQRIEVEVSVCQFFHELESFNRIKDLLNVDVTNEDGYNYPVMYDPMGHAITFSLYVNHWYQMIAKMTYIEKVEDDDDDYGDEEELKPF